jgi:hypothetical protein|tara:strand:+ start:59 stop:289 length:231 start_codon:yes stop_codon:yes gene_type:complete
LQILFEDEFEEYLFARWADYCEAQIDGDKRLSIWDFEELHKKQILLFYKASKVNKEKSIGDFQQWLSNLNGNKTLH